MDSPVYAPGNTSRRTGWRPAAVLLIAIVMAAACTSTANPPGAPGTSTPQAQPASPNATNTPPTGSPSASPVLDLSSLQDLAAPVESITASEDPASSIAAIVEYGPNPVGLARTELHRGADGSIRAIVGFDETGRWAAVFFDAESRPEGAIGDDGTRLDVSYPPGAVEVTYTFVDGTIMRVTQPFVTGFAPRIAPVSARLAAVHPQIHKVDYPRSVFTTGFVRAETTRADGKPVAPDAVRYTDPICVSSDPFVDCVAQVGLIDTLGRIGVTNTVAVPPSLQGEGKIWRTQADCQWFKDNTSLFWKGSGTLLATAVFAFGAYRLRSPPLWQQATAGLAAAILYANFAASQAISWVPWAVSEDCGTVPSLEKIRDAVLDDKEPSTVTVAVTAEPTKSCDQSSIEGLRIRDAVNEVTISPLARKYRSGTPEYRPGEGEIHGAVKDLGTIRFVASACEYEMSGPFETASLAGAADLGFKDLAAFEEILGENLVTLTIDPSDKPTDPSPAKGDFVFAIILPDEILWTIHGAVGEALTGSTPTMDPAWAGCTATMRFAGKMTGTAVPKGAEWVAEGTAGATSTMTLAGCEATGLRVSPPQKMSGIRWKFTGAPPGSMKGSVVITDPDDGSRTTLKAEIRGK